VYYDTGYVDTNQRADRATFKARVTLPPGDFLLERSDADWSRRETTTAAETVNGTVTVETALETCNAVAWSWRRQ